MLEQMKRWLRRRPAVESIAYLAHNNLLSRLNFSGTSLRGRSAAQAAEYVRIVAERYRTAATKLGRSFQDASVLEIGPGDNLAVALCVVAWGAREVVCIDRFNCLGDLHATRAVYRELLSTFTVEERERVVRSCPWCLDPQADVQGAVEFLPGIEVERCDQQLRGRQFDCVVSNAALEHVAGLPEGIEAMSRLVADVGWMFHEVDFRSHERFAAIGPLHFLTVPAWLWRAMTSNVGSPNRFRINAYRTAFLTAGFNGLEEIVESVDPREVERVYHRVDPLVGANCPEDLLPLVVRFTLSRAPARTADLQ